MAIPHLLAVHSTTSPDLTILLFGVALAALVLRLRARRGGGRGPFGGGGGFGRGGGRYGGGSSGGGGGGSGGSTGESNSPSDL